MLALILQFACATDPGHAKASPSGTASGGSAGSTSNAATGETGVPIDTATAPPEPGIVPRTPGPVTPFADRTTSAAGLQFLPYDLAVTDSGSACIVGLGFPDGSYDQVVGVELRVGPDGLPDPNHGVDGYVTADPSPPLSGVAAGPDDGCFVIAGADYYENGLADGFVFLLDATGRPDLRFAPWSNDLRPEAEVLVDLVGLADGGALVLRGDVDGMAVVHLLPDGSPDPSFGVGGMARLPVAMDCEHTTLCAPGVVRALPDHRLVAAAGSPGWAVVLDEAGDPDPSFGVGGVAVSSGTFRSIGFDASSTGATWRFGVELSADQGLVPWIEGLDPLGAPAVGPLGIALSAPRLQPRLGLVDSVGRLVIGGRVERPISYAGRAALVRTDGAGVPDPAFGVDGIDELGVTDDGSANVLALGLAGNDTVVGVAFGSFPVLVFAR